MGPLRNKLVSSLLTRISKRFEIAHKRRYLSLASAFLLFSAAGLALAAGLSHFLASMLYGVSAVDPTTYSGVVLLSLLVAASALLPILGAIA